MRILIATAILALAGCVSAPESRKLNEVYVGMTKSEVIAVMGTPDSTAAQDGVEYLLYSLAEGTEGGEAAVCAGMGVLTLGISYAAPECRGGHDKDYFVRLKGGQVDAYGKVGDFDSTKDPAITVNENITVKDGDQAD